MRVLYETKFSVRLVLLQTHEVAAACKTGTTRVRLLPNRSWPLLLGEHLNEAAQRACAEMGLELCGVYSVQHTLDVRESEDAFSEMHTANLVATYVGTCSEGFHHLAQNLPAIAKPEKAEGGETKARPGCPAYTDQAECYYPLSMIAGEKSKVRLNGEEWLGTVTGGPVHDWQGNIWSFGDR